MPPLSLTARRTLAARQIRVSLAEAQAELTAGATPDRQAQLEALVVALNERLGKRRQVVLLARQASLQRGIFNRRRRFRSAPVWGFPADYNPNLMGDRCDICRSISWTARPAGPNYCAWTCTVCPSLPTGIPDP